MVERLAGVMRPEYIPIWLRKPIRTLDHDTSLDAVAAGTGASAS